MTHYNTTQPRVCIISPADPETYEQHTRELGQGNTWGEATFWMCLGYAVEVSHWDGQCFRDTQHFTAADL